MGAWAADPWTGETLAALIADGYRPRAWWRFILASWRRAATTAARERALVGDWRRLSLALAAGATLPVGVAWRRSGRRPAARLARRLALALVVQQADLYVHLGMNRPVAGGAALHRLGAATALSALRTSAACSLLATQGAHIHAPGLAASTAIVGVSTDILDGRIARAQGHETALGAYLDGGADLMLALALTREAVRRGALPPLALLTLIARYAVPLVVAIAIAFTRGRSPRIAHAAVGQWCGLAHSALIASALAPPGIAARALPPRRVLLPLVAALSVAGGALQVRRLLEEQRRVDAA